MLLKLNRACIEKRVGEFQCRSTPMNMLNRKIHWSIRSKWTHAWKDQVSIALNNFRKEIKSKKYPLVKAKVIIKLFTCSLMDYDGAYGSVKPCLDSLTENGVIMDDSPKYIDLKVEQVKVNKKCDERVEMEIIDVNKNQ